MVCKIHGSFSRGFFVPSATLNQKGRKTHIMERKKLVYNALQDLWKIAANDYANKSIVDMEDSDWESLISAIDDSAKKYKKLRPEEEAFYGEVCAAFLSLIEREVKTEIEIPGQASSGKIHVWTDPKSAKERYGITIPERKPNKK